MRMKKIMNLSVVLLFSFSGLLAQKNIIDKSEEQIKMFNAQQRFYANDFQGAMSIYNDLLKGKPNDANLIFHIAECNFEMGQFDIALENAEKAKNIDVKSNENIHLLLGKLYHMNAKLDAALAEYSSFKTSLTDPKKVKESDIDMSIAQVNNAIEMMKNPVNVKIENMGISINSKYDDMGPSITADGKTLIFNSRRLGKSAVMDMEGDKKYFEDIYISHWDSTKNTWADAELLPGNINTEGHDACTSISPDGKEIFLYKNDIQEESRGGDIYYSRLGSSGKWGAPKSIGKPINTTYYEDGACISPDGKTIYFISERPGGFGHSDIYMSNQKGRDEWDMPVNLGSVVNTPEDEGGIFLAPDGKTLFFSSRGHNTMGGYDIFKTIYENGKWSVPVNLGYPVNTVNNDMSFAVSVDARIGYFCSDRTGGIGERDIYQIDLTKYPVFEKEMKLTAANSGPILAILKGDVFNASDGNAMEAEVVIFDETGARVGSTTSQGGNYFITLPAGKTYQVKIEVDGFKSIDEKVELKIAKEGATTIVKHYLLYKK